MKKLTKLLAITMVLTMVISANALACSPLYKPLSESGFTGVPDVELSDETKETIENAVHYHFEKCILDKPTVTSAMLWTQIVPKKTYASLIVTWDSVENATSYKVEVKNPDGTSKTYDTEYNFFTANSYKDDFIQSIANGSTARVKAYGENDTFSTWSDSTEITARNWLK